MRGKRSFLALAPALALTLVMSACGDGDTAGRKITFSIKIGGLLPLTGALSDFGPAMAKGVELAADVFEEAATKAGQDIKVEVVIEDSATDAAQGTEGARKLVDVDNVNVIVGAAASGVTIPVAQSVTIPGGIVQISPASTSGDITKLEDNDLVWRTPPSDEHQAPILAARVAEAFGADAKVSLGARNDAYGQFIIEGVKTELEKLGLTTTGPVLWDPNAATFDSEANRIVAGSPDGYVLIDFPGTWQKVGPALVRAGWDPAKTFSADGLKTSKLPSDPPTGSGRQTTEGMKGTAPGGTEAFDTLWEQRVGDALSRETFDSHSFDAAMVALLAAVAVGSNDPAQIKTKLRDVSGPGGTKYTLVQLDKAIVDLVNGKDIDYEGASGPIDFDENGDPRSIGAFYDIYEFRNGKMEVIGVEEVEAGA